MNARFLLPVAALSLIAAPSMAATHHVKHAKVEKVAKPAKTKTVKTTKTKAN
ncbi:MAG: hypothetical protein V4574_06720 [Pseudomonadota bacterium]